jgi:thiol:disulfide interchange protein
MSAMPGHPNRAGVLVVAAVLAALVGCGSTEKPHASSSPSATASAGAPIPTQYDEQADPVRDITAALTASRADGKDVLIDFGADWCPDCRVLDRLYHQPQVTRAIDDDFHLVLVDVGEFDSNIDVARRWGVDLRRSGIPALVVVRDGKVSFASNRGEFANARNMKAPSLLAFLHRWA